MPNSINFRCKSQEYTSTILVEKSESPSSKSVTPQEVAGHLLTDCEYINLPIPLANLVGLNAAAMLRVIEQWCTSNARHKKQHYFRDGQWWTQGTYQDWLDQFRFFGSVRGIQRMILGLEKQGLLISRCFGKSRFDKTKWYRVDREKLGVLYLEQFAEVFSTAEEAETTQNPIVPKCDIDSAKMRHSMTTKVDDHLYIKELIKEEREQITSLSGDKPLSDKEELANSEELIPGDLAEKITSRCQQIEKLNSLVEASPEISSASLPEKKRIFAPKPKSKSSIKKIAPRLFSRKTKNNYSPTKENEPLPQYRSQAGAGGIKDEYLDAIADYLTSTPHYQERKVKADRVDARKYVLHKEDKGYQQLLEEMYQKYCLKQKSTRVESVSAPRQIDLYADVEDNLYSLPKVWRR